MYLLHICIYGDIERSSSIFDLRLRSKCELTRPCYISLDVCFMFYDVL